MTDITKLSQLCCSLAEALDAMLKHHDHSSRYEIKLRDQARDALAAYRAQQAAPSEQPAQGELPALPIEWRKVEDADGIQVPVFRAFQMWDYARAALAQRPALVALTEDALLEAFCKARNSQHYASVFIAGARFAERAHGITAPVNAVNSPKAKDKQP